MEKMMKPSANINLMIRGQDGKQMFFRIGCNTKLKKLLTVYCDRRFLDFTTTRFLINGQLFSADKTAHQLGLEDGDEIDAMMEQLGGGGYIII